MVGDDSLIGLPFPALDVPRNGTPAAPLPQAIRFHPARAGRETAMYKKKDVPQGNTPPFSYFYAGQGNFMPDATFISETASKIHGKRMPGHL